MGFTKLFSNSTQKNNISQGAIQDMKLYRLAIVVYVFPFFEFSRLTTCKNTAKYSIIEQIEWNCGELSASLLAERHS